MEVLIILLLIAAIVAGLVWLHQAPPAAVVAFVERESVALAYAQRLAGRLKATLTPRPKPAIATDPLAPGHRLEPIVGLAPLVLSDHAKAVQAIMALPLSIEERIHLLESLKP